MRTTISIDDRLAEKLRARAAATGKSVSAFIAGILDDALERNDPPPEDPPFRRVTAGGEGVAPGIDLDRPRTLETMNDEAAWSARET